MKAFYLLLSIFLYASNLSEALASDFSFKYRLEILSMNQGLSQHDISSIAVSCTHLTYSVISIYIGNDSYIYPVQVLLMGHAGRYKLNI